MKKKDLKTKFNQEESKISKTKENNTLNKLPGSACYILSFNWVNLHVDLKSSLSDIDSNKDLHICNRDSKEGEDLSTVYDIKAITFKKAIMK